MPERGKKSFYKYKMKKMKMHGFDIQREFRKDEIYLALKSFRLL